jgi:hypothetical protein
MLKSATLSDDGMYRYWLCRRWRGGGARVCFVMLNPSTADAELDDPTIRRCIGFADRWGYEALDVVNLFAFRTTFPAELRLFRGDPIGFENDYYIRYSVMAARLVICAWGQHGRYLDRGEQVLKLIRGCDVQPMALRVNSDGSPAHPLYLPNNVEPRPL